MNWFELGWMLVCLMILACVLLYLFGYALDRITQIYSMSLYGSKESAIREYSNSLRKQSYWFHGRDKAVVEAVAMDMEQGLSYARADQIRDQYLPQTIDQNKD
jgi:hypothetical protein